MKTPFRLRAITRLLLFLFLSFPLWLQAQSWQFTGARQFSPNEGLSVSLALDGNNNPYVGFVNNGQYLVMKFDGSTWNSLGNVGPTWWTWSTLQSLAIDGNNVPYVVYADTSGQTSVKKYTGSNWVTVGSTGFTNAYGPVIKIDHHNTPYIVADSLVFKFNGASWVSLGNPQLNDYATTMAIDNNDTVYVVGQDKAHGNKVSVKKYTGAGWEQAGNADFSSTNPTSAPRIAFDAANHLFVSYDNNGGLIVKELVNGNWVNVGTTNFYFYSAQLNVTLAISDNGIPYVYSPWSVYHYNGSAWDTTGTLQGQEWPELAVDHNGTVYMAFIDSSTGGSNISVQHYGSVFTGINNVATNEQAISLYPNPVSGLLHFSFNAAYGDNVTLTITNMLGERVSGKNITPIEGMNYAEINVAALPPGIYTICAGNEKGFSATARFIRQ